MRRCPSGLERREKDDLERKDVFVFLKGNGNVCATIGICKMQMEYHI